jgi:hypothetical protein
VFGALDYGSVEEACHVLDAIKKNDTLFDKVLRPISHGCRFELPPTGTQRFATQHDPIRPPEAWLSGSLSTPTLKDLGSKLEKIDKTCGKVASMLSITRAKFIKIDAGVDAVRVDPRFAVFEYQFEHPTLRQQQVSAIFALQKHALEQESTCHQCPMGLGKTTVISPMLSLLLGDGKNVSMLLVPPALLEMSRGVLREGFGSLMYKPVFTFAFNRGDPGTDCLKGVEKLLERLKTAQDLGGVVCSDPSSVKSFFLKYIDMLHNDRAISPLLGVPVTQLPKRARDSLELYRPYLDKRAEEFIACQKIIRLWKSNGISIIDEVDTVLHPLKSELNFPVGEKVPLPDAEERWELPMCLIGHILSALQDAKSYDEGEAGSDQYQQVHIDDDVANDTTAKAKQERAIREVIEKGEKGLTIKFKHTQEQYHSSLRLLTAATMNSNLEMEYYGQIVESSSMD